MCLQLLCYGFVGHRYCIVVVCNTCMADCLWCYLCWVWSKIVCMMCFRLPWLVVGQLLSAVPPSWHALVTHSWRFLKRRSTLADWGWLTSRICNSFLVMMGQRSYFTVMPITVVAITAPQRSHSSACRMTWCHLKLSWWRTWVWRCVLVAACSMQDFCDIVLCELGKDHP